MWMALLGTAATATVTNTASVPSTPLAVNSNSARKGNDAAALECTLVDETHGVVSEVDAPMPAAAVRSHTPVYAPSTVTEEDPVRAIFVTTLVLTIGVLSYVSVAWTVRMRIPTETAVAVPK
jgi:hypothetical protein